MLSDLDCTNFYILIPGDVVVKGRKKKVAEGEEDSDMELEKSLSERMGTSFDDIDEAAAKKKRKLNTLYYV